MDEYLHLMTDPAHMAVEATFIVLVDVVFGLLLWPLAKRLIRRHDNSVHDTTDVAFRPDVEDVRSELLDMIEDLQREVLDLQREDF